MNNYRFALVVFVLFALAFGGMSYFGMTMFGAPSPKANMQAVSMPTIVLKPEARTETLPVTTAMKPDTPSLSPERERGIKSADIADPAPSKAQTAGDGRAQLALTAISAANAYALSPCNPAAKAAFIVAASTYSRSVAERPDTANVTTGGMDPRVRDAMSTAFNAGGVSPEEFPVGTMVPITAKAATSCGGGRRVENSRR